MLLPAGAQCADVLRAWSDFKQREVQRTQDEEAQVSVPRGARKDRAFGGQWKWQSHNEFMYFANICRASPCDQEPRSVVGSWDSDPEDLCLPSKSSRLAGRQTYPIRCGSAERQP